MRTYQAIAKFVRGALNHLNLITILCVATLLYFVIGRGFVITERSVQRSRSDIVIRAARSALEVYKEKFGSYPGAATPDLSVTIDGRLYRVGGAACLYQALTGDGTDQIHSAGGRKSTTASNGELEATEEVNITLNDIPRELWAKSGDTYFLVDGFGHPIQYVKAASVVPGQPPPAPITVNRGSYDIWSYGEDKENTTASSLQAAGVAKGTGLGLKWLRNW